LYSCSLKRRPCKDRDLLLLHQGADAGMDRANRIAEVLVSFPTDSPVPRPLNSFHDLEKRPLKSKKRPLEDP
jgi:hypothetical protein